MLEYHHISFIKITSLAKHLGANLQNTTPFNNPKQNPSHCCASQFLQPSPFIWVELFCWTVAILRHLSTGLLNKRTLDLIWHPTLHHISGVIFLLRSEVSPLQEFLPDSSDLSILDLNDPLLNKYYAPDALASVSVTNFQNVQNFQTRR